MFKRYSALKFVYIDGLLAVLYTSSLPKLPAGHFAIWTVSVTYSLINHDYLHTSPHGGLTYSKFIQATKSASYKNVLSRFNKTWNQ